MEQLQEQFTQFTTIMSNYIELGNIIDEKKQELDELSNNRKLLEEDIVNFIQKNNMDETEFKLKSHIISLKKKSMPEGITQKYIKYTITKYYTEKYKNTKTIKEIGTEINELVNFIINNRSTSEKKVLECKLINNDKKNKNKNDIDNNDD